MTNHRPTRWRTVALASAVDGSALAALAVCVVIVVPHTIDEIVSTTARADALAATLTAGAVTAFLAGPVFGWVIDRTRRRMAARAWAVLGSLVGAAGLVTMLTSTQIGQTIAGWVLAQAGYNVVFVVVTAAISTAAAPGDRVRASAAFTGVAFVSPLAPFVLIAVFPAAAWAIALGLAAAAVVATAFVSLPVPAVPEAAARVRPARLPRAFWGIWAQRFAIQSALGLTTAFSLYLVADRAISGAADPQQVVAVSALVGGLGVGAGALLAGAVATDGRRGRMLLLSGALAIATAASVRAFAEVPVAVWAASLLGGVGVGVYLSVNLALAMRYAREAGHATAMGVLNAAESLPTILVPLVAGLLLRVGDGDPLSPSSNNYVVLALTGGAVALLTGVTSARLRARTAASSPSARDAPADVDAR